MCAAAVGTVAGVFLESQMVDDTLSEYTRLRRFAIICRSFGGAPALTFAIGPASATSSSLERVLRELAFPRNRLLDIGTNRTNMAALDPVNKFRRFLRLARKLPGNTEGRDQ